MAERATINPKFQEVLDEAIKEYDFSLLKGERGKEEQNSDYDNGATTLKYPNSNHNKSPSDAGDCVPYPINWNILSRFYRMIAAMFRAANKVKAKIRSGGDWRRDGSLNNYTVPGTNRKPLMDLPHIEYKGVADEAEIKHQKELAKIYDNRASELEALNQ